MADSVSWVQENLVSTLSKKEVILTLKEWRDESRTKVESDLINDLLKRVRSGELDG